MKVKVKNLQGEVVKEKQVASELFGVEVNNTILSQVYIAQESNKRVNVAHTKTRGEIKGSTRKPWKQKGTGRARTGSVKNPIWRKGGVVFGPRNDRNYNKKINKKIVRLANLMALSGKFSTDELIVVDSFKEAKGKTKKMSEALSRLGIEGRTLFAFVSTSKRDMLSTRNLPGCKNVLVDNLNVLDVLKYKYLVMEEKGIDLLEKKYLSKCKK